LAMPLGPRMLYWCPTWWYHSKWWLGTSCL